MNEPLFLEISFEILLSSRILVNVCLLLAKLLLYQLVLLKNNTAAHSCWLLSFSSSQVREECGRPCFHSVPESKFVKILGQIAN